MSIINNKQVELVDDGAFLSAVLLLRVIHNKKVSHFSISLLRDTAACSLFIDRQFQMVLHFKKISSDRSLSGIRACPIWTKNQTTTLSTAAVDAGMTKERRKSVTTLSYAD